MRSLKFYLLTLLVAITLLFNIERLDLGQENALDIQSFVYFLALFVVTMVVFIPSFSRHRVTLSIAFALSLYLLCKLYLFRDRPFFGGLYTYVSTTEIAFLTILAFTSHRLAHSLAEFQEGFATMALHMSGKYLHNSTNLSAAIRREISRSRHYHRPLSVIVVRPDEESFQFALPSVFEELQKALVHRFARLKLAQSMQQHLRLMDLILEEDVNNDFIIVCPEADTQGSAAIIDRIQTVLNQSGIAAKYSNATFPEEALTFEGLVNQAKAKLPDHDLPNIQKLTDLPDVSN